MQTRRSTYANEDKPRINRALSLHREYCVTLAVSFNGIYFIIHPVIASCLRQISRQRYSGDK